MSYGLSSSSFTALYKRGYTGHEHIDAFLLINMNGRIYDPRLARFLSPDPYIQSPGYTQSYNRYSYVWNNPMKYVDPSGYAAIQNWYQFFQIVHNLMRSPHGGSYSTSSGYTYYSDVQVTPSGGIKIYTGGSGSGGSSSPGGVNITFRGWESIIKGSFRWGGFRKLFDPRGLTCRGINSRGKTRSWSIPYPKFDFVRTSGSDNYVLLASINPYDWGEPGDGWGDTNSQPPINDQVASASGGRSAVATVAPIALTLAAIDGPFIPVGDVISGIVLAGAAAYDAKFRVYITYTLTNGNSTYVGRASGYGTPHQIMMRRYSSHHMRSFGYINPVLDRAVQGIDGYPAIRGREQQLIDSYGGVGSPNVGNIIRGVGYFNPGGRGFHLLSNLYFGPLAPYTGF